MTESYQELPSQEYLSESLDVIDCAFLSVYANDMRYHTVFLVSTCCI